MRRRAANGCPSPRKNGERGRALRERGGNGEGATCPFASLAGRRWRQPDEGRIHPIISMT
ncbi:hypothetical protein GFL24_29445 [Rhizobium laguerreae]|nr:hypothetical protein [Rhizobium laguerreae]NKN12171.1 hypothetical protein [Rhizobium laguerreae]